MIKALPFSMHSPNGRVLDGLLQPGGQTTHEALGLTADMGLSPKTPVLLTVFNINDSLNGGKGVSAKTRELFPTPSPVKEFRFCAIYARETPDRRTRNKGQLFLAGKPAPLAQVFANLAQATADHGGSSYTDSVLLAAGCAFFYEQGDITCVPCDSTAADKFGHEQEPAAFRSSLRTLKL